MQPPSPQLDPQIHSRGRACLSRVSHTHPSLAVFTWGVFGASSRQIWMGNIFPKKSRLLWPHRVGFPSVLRSKSVVVLHCGQRAGRMIVRGEVVLVVRLRVWRAPEATPTVCGLPTSLVPGSWARRGTTMLLDI